MAGAVADRRARGRAQRELERLRAALRHLDGRRRVEARRAHDQLPPPPPASLSSNERVSTLRRAHEPEGHAGRRCEEPGSVGRLHVDHAAARREHARRVLVRGVVEDGPCRQHERRLDLRGRPIRVALAQQRGRSRDRGGGHARSRPRAVAAGDRRDDVDPGRGDVGLERERVRRRAARRERRDQPRVGRDLLLLVVVHRERQLTARDGRLLRQADADQVGDRQRAQLAVVDRLRIARVALREDDAERARARSRPTARAEVHCGPSCTSTSAPARPPPQVLETASGIPAFHAGRDLIRGIRGGAERGEVGRHGAGPGDSEPRRRRSARRWSPRP